jgi:hypothetical protein
MPMLRLGLSYLYCLPLTGVGAAGMVNPGAPQVPACAMCPRGVAPGAYCPSCVNDVLSYPRQAVAYKKAALRDVADQARALLRDKGRVFEAEQRVIAFRREADQTSTKILQVSAACLCAS